MFGLVPATARIGIDTQATTVADLDRIRRCDPPRLISNWGQASARMREVKRPDELERIGDAAAVLDRTNIRSTARTAGRGGPRRS